MKKMAAAIFVVFVVLLMAFVALRLAVNARRQTIASREPLTLDTLDKLATTWKQTTRKKAAQETGTESIQSSVEANTPTSDDSSSAKTEEQTSETPHLKRTLTKDELVEWRTREESRQKDSPPPRWQWKVAFAVFEQRAMFTAATAGSSEAVLWFLNAGAAAEALHDWQTATNYYREVLDSSPDESLRRLSCCRLAWLEEDSGVAERLLELSCESDDPYCMLEAIRLAEATGSGALREHYLARLKALDTESATWVLKMLEGAESPDTP